MGLPTISLSNGITLHTRQENYRDGWAQMLPIQEGAICTLYKNIHSLNLYYPLSHQNVNVNILQTPAPAELFCLSSSRAVWGKKRSELPN